MATISNGLFSPISRFAGAALTAVRGASGRLYHVGKPAVLYPVQKILNTVAHGLNAVEKLRGRFKAAPRRVSFTDQKVKEIKSRMNTAPATDKQILETVNRFGTNFGSFVPMRLIDQFLTGKIHTTDFYFDLVTGCKTLKDYRKVYFKNLNESHLFFLIRWIAKLSYIALSPFFKHTIEGSLESLSKKFNDDLKNYGEKHLGQMMKVQLNKSNEVLGAWIDVLKNVGKSDQLLRPLKDVLKNEVQKRKYHNGMTPAEFYKQLTSNIVNKYLILDTLGKKLSRLLLIKPTNPLVLLNLITIPIILITQLLLLLPESIFELAIKKTVKNSLKKNKFLEMIIENTLGEISTSKGLTTPVLRALNSSLEEILVDLKESQHQARNRSIKTTLSVKNQTALQKNVRLSKVALDLYDKKAVKDLKYRINHGPNFAGQVDKYFNVQIAKGIEDVIIIMHEKLRSPAFIKQSAFNILDAVNRSFENPVKDDDKTFIEEEKRFFVLLQTLLTTGVHIAVSNAVSKYGVIEKNGSAFNLISSQIYARCFKLIKKTINMNTSHEFLRFVLNNALNEFFGKDS